MLIERLQSGWSTSLCRPVKHLVRLWERRFKTWVKSEFIGDNEARFVMDLSKVHLRGMDKVSCLIVSGDANSSTRVLREFWSREGKSGYVPYVLAVSKEAHHQAVNLLSKKTCLLLSAEELVELLDSENPILRLKSLLRKQISRRTLNPYDFNLPTNRNMFFGRRKELNRLCEEGNTNFAVTGPCRIGKTSLLRQYEYEMKSRGDNRIRHRIDFYDCEKRTSDGVARFIASKIKASSDVYHMTAKGLVDYLKRQYSIEGQPLELLLDEVDGVCHTEAFEFLGHAAKGGLCRLILCGRGALFKMLLDKGSAFECRLEMIRPEPLDHESAQKLILGPLEDLGFVIEEQERVVRSLFDLTGRLPHLLQYSGKMLVSLALDQNLDTISLESVDSFKDKHESSLYFMSPLHELGNGETGKIAWYLLKHAPQEFKAPYVKEHAKNLGFSLDFMQAAEICDELVISNILAWDRGSYRIATGALRHYASQAGLIE